MDNCKECCTGNALDRAAAQKRRQPAVQHRHFVVVVGFRADVDDDLESEGRYFALFPSIILNPPWTKKYFMKLQAIEILGGDKMQGIGLFKGQSYLIAQFQYNFNLM